MSDRLSPDEAMGPGHSITSPDGRATLVMQNDGNLVIYSASDAVLWSLF